MKRAVLVLALVWLGCGDNQPGLTFDEFEAARRAATCAYMTRCGLYGTEAACEAASPHVPDVDLIAALDEGRVELDHLAAKRCLVEIREASCDVTRRDARFMVRCLTMFDGKVEIDEPCVLDAECVSGVCAKQDCTSACCAGACKPRSLVGAACTGNAACGIDAFCNGDLVCEARVVAGGKCRTDDECADGTGCVGAGIEPGTCRQLPLLGASCPYQRCADVGARCSDAGVCVSWGFGSACASDAECSFYGRCDLTTQRCVELPLLGMPCTERCAGDAWCNLDTGQCDEPFANGESCITGDQCAAHYCAEGPVFDTCATKPVCRAD